MGRLHLAARGDVMTPNRPHAPRATDALLLELSAGTASLAALTERWGPLPPAPGELAGAVATVEGLRRLLAELQPRAVEGQG